MQKFDSERQTSNVEEIQTAFLKKKLRSEEIRR